MRVYLSGGMEYADGEGAAWRKEIQQWLEQNLGHEVFNPNVESERIFRRYEPNLDFRKLKYDDIVRYREMVQRIVDFDCREIAHHSDYLVCYWDEGALKGAGTKGELTMAKFFGKPVYVVTRYPLHEIPGWVLGCVTKFFGSFNELKEFLSAESSIQK